MNTLTLFIVKRDDSHDYLYCNTPDGVDPVKHLLASSPKGRDIEILEVIHGEEAIRKYLTRDEQCDIIRL